MDFRGRYDWISVNILEFCRMGCEKPHKKTHYVSQINPVQVAKPFFFNISKAVSFFRFTDEGFEYAQKFERNQTHTNIQKLNMNVTRNLYVSIYT